ncbi:MAG TPA: DUF362 domain-containing protein [Blastocatellia bacterium]|nr:DUF362 domain-containing protein [Blastocatellia bacterium]
MSETEKNLTDPRVAAIRLPAADYPLQTGEEDPVSLALRSVAQMLGWADPERGPFGSVIQPGARVLIKPNFVLHENQGGWGMKPLITHASVVRAATAAALKAGAGQVIVGDAPVQGCDYERLLGESGLSEWAETLSARNPRFAGIRDFRRTTCEFVNGVRHERENRLPADQFLLFDLKRDSLLEAVTDQDESFRVTCYDPRLLARTHAPGRHQYLIAREVIEADVVINLPKLKTHKKAGLTCALKNLVGINGNKEYLPHHRLGGSHNGGDCYPGGSVVKRTLEFVYDRQNTTASLRARTLWQQAAVQLNRVLHLTGDNVGIEGSWSGNDTIWRTTLDLNRVLMYGRTDGTLARTVQRRVIHLVDAIVAGQGDGPLASQPLALGLLLGGNNPAAVDYIGAQLLGYSPQRLPLVREAFADFRWPLTTFTPDEVLLSGLSRQSLQTAGAVIHPAGWRDAAAQRPAQV